MHLSTLSIQKLFGIHQALLYYVLSVFTKIISDILQYLVTFSHKVLKSEEIFSGHGPYLKLYHIPNRLFLRTFFHVGFFQYLSIPNPKVPKNCKKFENLRVIAVQFLYIYRSIYGPQAFLQTFANPFEVKRQRSPSGCAVGPSARRRLK